MDRKIDYQNILDGGFEKIISNMNRYNEIQLYIQYAEHFSRNGFNLDKHIGRLYMLKSERIELNKTMKELTNKVIQKN
jgi:hypothetical protein